MELYSIDRFLKDPSEKKLDRVILLHTIYKYLATNNLTFIWYEQIVNDVLKLSGFTTKFDSTIRIFFKKFLSDYVHMFPNKSIDDIVKAALIHKEGVGLKIVSNIPMRGTYEIKEINFPVDDSLLEAAIKLRKKSN